MHTKFWSNWIIGVCNAGIAFCLTMLIPDVLERTLGPLAYDTVAGPGSYAQLAVSDLAVQRLIYGILGAVMIGWFIMIAFLAAVPFRRGERWAWLAIDISLGTWFVIDSTISIMHGMPTNVLGNLIFLALFGIPLVFTYSQFAPLQALRLARA